MSQDPIGQESNKKMLPAVAVAGAAIVLGMAFDFLFFKHAPGLSVPIFWMLVLGAVVLFDRLAHRRLNWLEIWYAALILLLSLFFAIRASDFLMVLNSVAIFYLFLLILANLYGLRVKAFRLADFFIFPLVDIMSAVFDSFGIFEDLRPRRIGSRRLVYGLLGAVVFVLIFGTLFASADRIVFKLLQSVFTDALSQVVQHTLIVLFVSLVVLLGLAPAFWKRMAVRVIEAAKTSYDYGFEAMMIFVASNLVFGGFIVVQAMYLFGGKGNVSLLDITYAQYAREGFFQLLVVALIVACMVWAMRRVSASRFHLPNAFLQGVLILQTLAVLASSWIRLSLYEEEFGFTALRLFSHYFLIVVAIMLALFLVSIFVRWADGIVLHGVVSIFAVALLGLNVVNPDFYIATKNIERAGASSQKLDLGHLLSLSDDAAKPIAAYLNGRYQALALKQQEVMSANQQISQIDKVLLAADREFRVLQSSFNPRGGNPPEMASRLQDLPNQIRDLKTKREELVAASRQQDDGGWQLMTIWATRRTPTDWQSWNIARRDGVMYRAPFAQAAATSTSAQ